MSDRELREEILELINGYGAEPDQIDAIGADLQELAENRRSDREGFLG